MDIFQSLEESVPCFYEGVDYSDFHPKLFSVYREEHLKSLSLNKKPPMVRGEGGVAWNLKMIQYYLLNDKDKLANFVLENHTSLCFQEAFKLNGAVKHMTRCRAQYKVSKRLPDTNILHLTNYKSII